MIGRTYKVQWMQVLGKSDAAGRHDQGKLGSFRIYIYVYMDLYIYICTYVYMTSPRDIPGHPHLLRPGFQGNGGRATQLPTCGDHYPLGIGKMLVNHRKTTGKW